MNELIDITNVRMPCEKADAMQAVLMDEGFKQSGANISLWVPRQHQTNPDLKGVDPYEFHNIKDRFPIVRILTLDTMRFHNWMVRNLGIKIMYPIQETAFALSAFFKLLFEGYKNKVIFIRSIQAAFFLVWLPGKKKVYFESHEVPEGRFWKWVFRSFIKRMTGIVSVSEGLRQDLIELGANPQKVIVESGAIEDKWLQQRDQREAREKCGLPLEGKIVLYGGQFLRWKGVHTFARAVKNLPKDVHVIMVGGSPEHESYLNFKQFLDEEGVENITLTGFKPPATMPYYLAAADVLVIPNTANNSNSFKYTSPMKLFEYMASQRIIVASDLPSIREVIDENSAIMVTPDDAEALERSIREALEDNETNRARVEEAYERIRRRTWRARAERIMKFIGLPVTSEEQDRKPQSRFTTSHETVEPHVEKH